ncbi:MAG: hypothetical protein Q8922_15780 [Bacteroidota bacterium]|nr:hypothetical protein [Bacteroidota bacterium]MDP4232761.1 hypothetical protein [Bacteroidota bacterium]MDP4242557.1 hypothetical protein [Bacteroidota bacterium]MDP4289374.1 hypothetical protein [Bacteroidota bacterium]
MSIDQDIEGFEPELDAKIEIFRPYVDLVLYAFDVPPEEALWVNDESVIADIMAGDDDLPVAIESLGFKFTERDYVWEVAAFLKKTGEE